MPKTMKDSKSNSNRVMVIRNNEVVASAQNLEVITRYNRNKASITSMDIEETSGGEGDLTVKFSDGAKVKTKFASFRVLSDWADKKASRFGFNITEKRTSQLLKPGMGGD